VYQERIRQQGKRISSSCPGEGPGQALELIGDNCEFKLVDEDKWASSSGSVPRREITMNAE
jgi:hypothetical protein